MLAGCSGLPGLAPSRSSWAFDATGLETLHKQGLDGSGVRVGLVDTGIDPGHPALRGVHLVAWLDVTDGKPDPYDPTGHGTHVASLLAGQGRLRGGAPGVELVVAKAFDGQRQATDSTVAEGIRFAADHGAQVIGLSLGGGTLPVLGTLTEDAVRSALARGIVVVAAAGNQGPDNPDVASPGSVAGAIAVAAVDRDRHVAGFSNRGAASSGPLGLTRRQAPDEKPEVSAPGVDIVGAWANRTYASASGTSQAVPFVVAAIALGLQAAPGARSSDAQGVERIKADLAASASPVPGATRPHDPAAGYGFLDAVALRDRLLARS